MHNFRTDLKGYTTPRRFSGFQIPVSLQSMAIRRYCSDHELMFNHHVSENITSDSYLVLERLISESGKGVAIGMCSLGMLPKDSDRRSRMLAECAKKGTSVHFVFEQLVLRSESDLDTLNEFLTLTTLLDRQSNRIQQVSELMDLSEKLVIGNESHSSRRLQ